MAKLMTMPNLNWSVVCTNGAKTFWWLYVFSADKTVRWKDEHNGKSGRGTWSIENNQLVTRWHGSATVEWWTVPIDTDNWAGNCTMHKTDWRLSAKARNYTDQSAAASNMTEEGRKLFVDRCRLARGTVDLAYHTFRPWFLRLANAYGAAYEEHSRLMNRISAAERLADRVIFGLILTAVSGAAAGAIAGVMKEAGAQDFMIDAVKDLAKGSARVPGNMALDQLRSNGMPVSPLRWQNSVDARIEDELNVLRLALQEWDEAASSYDSSMRYDIDPLQWISGGLQISTSGFRIRLLSPMQFDEAAVQADFQGAMLRGWIRQHGSSVPPAMFFRSQINSMIIDYGRAIGMPDIVPLVDEFIPIEIPDESSRLIPN